jgi:hypothetical protein
VCSLYSLFLEPVCITFIGLENFYDCKLNTTFLAWCMLPQLKEFLTFSVKDRYQLNYFICIKDFNAQPIISLELNLFFSFIYCRQHHQRKTICFYIFLFSETVGYRTPVFIQPFSWCLHITITYHLPHLRL